MSADVTLDADQLTRLAAFLRLSTSARVNTNVRADAYGPLSVDIDGNIIGVRWDSEREQYIVDDRVGS